MELTSILIFILSFLRWDFLFKRSPTTINFLLVQSGIAVNYVGGGLNATWTADGYSNIQETPLFISRSGYFRGGSFEAQASDGALWSGTAYSGTRAYRLYYDSSNVYPAYDTYRQPGFPVRCITRNISAIIQKNNQDMCLFFFSY